jgi:hypothetical protein
MVDVLTVLVAIVAGEGSGDLCNCGTTYATIHTHTRRNMIAYTILFITFIFEL